MPTLGNGTPLCTLPEFRRNPHAWVKLWKHHATEPEANEISSDDYYRRGGNDVMNRLNKVKAPARSK